MVDAALVLEPVWTRLQDNYKAVFFAGDLLPPMTQTVGVVRTDYLEENPDIIRGIRAAADWLDARDRYETETREQLRALVNRHGMADRTCPALQAYRQ